MTALVRFTVPSSKSQTQRALLLAALAQGESYIEQPLDCDDSQQLRRALSALGTQIEIEPTGWRIRGRVLRPSSAPLWCGDAGTALRFLAPLALLLEGELILDGSPRLKERPMQDLVVALEILGVEAHYLHPPDGLPLLLRRVRQSGHHTAIQASSSSQFISGLLLVGPLLPEGLELMLQGPVVSRPYLSLTVETMRRFGATVHEAPSFYRVPRGDYQPQSLAIEGDWSSAAFLLAAAWITGQSIQIENINSSSAQGDRVFVDFLAELAQPRKHSFNLCDCPDLVAPLAAAAVFANHPVDIMNIAHARHKESDRLAVLANNFSAAGVPIQQLPDGLHLEPGTKLTPALLDPHGDHRMAMALGLLSLRQPGIQLINPGCVSKSYPSFWDDLERFR